jgi:peroxiredoxin
MKLAVSLLLVVASTLPAQHRRAPGFSLPDTNLQQYDLQDYRGKIVVVEFMRTDCPTCKTLTNTVAEVNDKFAGKVQVLYIVNPPDNQSTVAAYIKEQSMRGPVLFDCGQVTASYTGATARNPTVHLPQLYIIDADGFIRSHSGADGNPGELLSKSIAGVIEELLAGKALR